MPDGKVAAELAAIREDLRVTAGLERAGGYETPTAALRHAQRLLAAAEAVLAQHQPGRVVVLGALCRRHEAHRHFSITGAEAADVTGCPECAAAVYESCAGCGTQMPLDSCPARKAITTELTREDASVD